MSKDKIEVFGSSGCPFCVKAVQLLNQLDLEFENIDVFKDNNKEILAKKRGLDNLKGQTIPQIFINGEFIGGYTELRARY